LASLGEDRMVRLWDIPSGRQLAFAPACDAVAFHPDGSRLYFGDASDKGERKYLDLQSLQLNETPCNTRHSTCLAVSPDGKSLALGAWGSQAPWHVATIDLNTGRELHRLKGHGGKISSIRYSPDGNIMATVADDAVIRLWDTSTGARLRQLAKHSRSTEFY